MFSPWPHQLRGVGEALKAIDHEGRSAVVVTSPTGGGKTWMMEQIIKDRVAKGRKVALYSNRKLLTLQIARCLMGAEIPFGVRAAEFEDYENPDAPVQICSLQTENARVIRRRRKLDLDGQLARNTFPLFPADDVLWDEAHLQKGTVAERILREHLAMGAKAIGFTATPLGISHLYDHLIVAGTNSELRECGALLPAYVYACPEIDTRGIERVATGEYNLADIRRKCWSQVIYGNVLENLKANNPDLRPTILFAPGVDESLYFAKFLSDNGIKSAHIDGEDCWVDGERHRSVRGVRDQIISALKSGEVKVICNRFVLREAVDIPELYCCVLATPIGSLLSYVQIVGRVLRSHPSLDHVIINDHGGCWYRHGSPNANRDDIWREYFYDDIRVPTDVRREHLRTGREPTPINCPKCGAVQQMPRSGRCYNCNADLRHKRVRTVIQRNGRLIEVTGLPYKPRRVSETPEMIRAWQKAYWICAKSQRGKAWTFAQARAMITSGHLAGYEHLAGLCPPDNLKFMPKREKDWFMPVRDVRREDLL